MGASGSPHSALPARSAASFQYNWPMLPAAQGSMILIFNCSGFRVEASNSKWLLLPCKKGRWQLEPPDRSHTKAARPGLLMPALGYGNQEQA